MHLITDIALKRWIVLTGWLFAVGQFGGHSRVYGEVNWITMAPGMEIAHFPLPREAGKGTIVVARLDPHRLWFGIYSSKHLGLEKLTVREWAQRFQLMAVVNAGMYHTDQRTHVAYLKHFDVVNNPRPVRRYYSAAAFHPVRQHLPPFRIFDLDEVPLDTVRTRYHTVIQNLRLIKRPGENRWSPENREAWSVVALGEDRQGNVLFLFCRQPLTMYTFNRIVLSLPIHLVAAQYLEGGPEASLYLKGEHLTVQRMGALGEAFGNEDTVPAFLPLPVVIGVQATTPVEDE